MAPSTKRKPTLTTTTTPATRWHRCVGGHTRLGEEMGRLSAPLPDKCNVDLAALEMGTSSAIIKPDNRTGRSPSTSVSITTSSPHTSDATGSPDVSTIARRPTSPKRHDDMQQATASLPPPIARRFNQRQRLPPALRDVRMGGNDAERVMCGAFCVVHRRCVVALWLVCWRQPIMRRWSGGFRIRWRGRARLGRRSQ